MVPIPEFAAAATAAAFLIFVAEFGDKSQLMVLALATRHRALPVVVGLVAAAAVIQGISVAVGALVGEILPERLVAIVAGAAFLAVAAWMLRPDDDDQEAHPADVAPRAAGWWRVAAIVAGAFLLAELGDKTMLATFALAARQDALATWIGSTAGEVAANLVAVAVGRQVRRFVSDEVIRLGSAGLFALFGLLLLAGALLAAA